MSIEKKRISFLNSVTLFVLVQIFFLVIIGLWVRLLFSDNEIYPSLKQVINFAPFTVPAKSFLSLCGLTLIVLNSAGTVLLFCKLIRQTKINRIYDNFIVSMTHDLRTPIASIQIIGETLANRDLSDRTYFDFLSRLENDTKRLNQLTESILEISKIYKKRDIFSPVTLPADNYIRTAVKVLQSQFNLDEESISVIGYSRSQIKIDPSAFTAVLSNLIDNSIKYGYSPVKIRIYLGSKKKKFIMIFSDEGIGISRKYRKRVFQKFVQLKTPPDSSYKGLGLGLSWCREILQIHKGKIQIQQKRKSEGTLFYIEMPIEKTNNY